MTTSPRKKAHNERCRECKENVHRLLLTLFEEVEENGDIDLPAGLEDYSTTHVHTDLERIHQALQQHRGHSVFVRARKLPRVDWFLPRKKIIVEFDESQHFTEPRGISLGLYQNADRYGFSIHRWHSLCRSLVKRDNDPPFRDEQRAWYDTVRDFAPLVWGAGITVRLYARDLAWCSLNPAADADVEAFSRLIAVEEIGRHDKRRAVVR